MEQICQHFNVFGLVPVTLPVVSFCVNPCAEDRFYGALQIMVIPYPLMYCCASINREIDRTIPLRIKTARPAPSCQRKASGRLLLILMVTSVKIIIGPTEIHSTHQLI